MPKSRSTLIAMAGAVLMMAHQVSGKAVRDSFFLTHYPASDLPKMAIASAALSVVFVLLFARLIGRFGPAKMVPAGFFLSSLLHVIEYLFLPDSPGSWSIVIYLHIVALGAILLSGFWSLMTEAFDPREAKQAFGRITALGTLGGILGGLLAERVAAVFSASSVLWLLVAFHLLCSAALLFARSAAPPPAAPAPQKPASPVALFRRAPYLAMIATVVLAGASSAAILDYLFKAGAGATLGKGAELLRFFAVFYTATQVVTFLAQTFLVQKSLQKAGIGRTISTLPFGVGAGALGSLLAPVFPIFALARSLESVLRGSLYRSGYELLYTPIPEREKRSAKTLIDVAFDRTGEALGSAIVQAMLWLGASFVTSGLLGIALVMAAAGVWLSLKLDGTYARLVQQRLVDRAVELDFAEAQDLTTRSALILLPSAKPSVKPAVRPLQADDATIEMLRELRSGDGVRTLSALKRITQPTPLIASQALSLLAWDEVSEAAIEALKIAPDRITGLLIDHLTNRKDVEFGIRRRIPKILQHCNSQLAVHGLLAGMEDERFEVRFQCSRALDALVVRRPDMKVPADVVFAAVERELKVSRPIWSSRRLIDKRNESDPNAYLDKILKERADRSLEHVFSLFAAVLPREPIKIAFRALHVDDKRLRGLAAEYLDSILPADLRKLLWAMVEPGLVRQGAAKESGREALANLLESHESLMLTIDLKAGSGKPEPPQK